MSVSENLDLSSLPEAPLVSVDYGAILEMRKALLTGLWDAARIKNPDLPPLDTLLLATEPATILNEEFAYAEMIVLQSINDSGKQLRLAQATGPNLDHLTTTYHRTSRKVLRPATDAMPELQEGNEDLRSRAQLAPEALADMGLTPGGYVYKVRTAFADRIKHVFPIHRGGGRVELRVLGRDGDGTVPGPLLAEIADAFRIEEGSQSTDVLTVLSAEIVPVVWDVTLVMWRGPDRGAIEAEAATALAAAAAKLHRINATHYRLAIGATAKVGPVLTVRINSPTEDVLGRPEAAPYVTAINVSTEVQ